jgi:hypothetical protein
MSSVPDIVLWRDSSSHRGQRRTTTFFEVAVIDEW